MGLIDFFKKKQTRFLMPDISYFNPSSEWAFDNDDKSSRYIENGYKTLPNVYGLISAILQKSTIVPFEVYKVKSRSAEQKYKALMKDGKNVTKALAYKAKAYDQVYDTDLEKLLLNPNGYQSRQDYLWEVDGYKLLTGNSYVYTIKLGNKSKELHPIPSPFVDLIVKGSPFSPVFSYKVSYLQNPLPGDDVLHFKYWNPVTGTQKSSRQFLGQSPLQSCRMLLGRYKDADVTQGFMFKNQGPRGLLTGDKDTTITQDQAISLQDRFRQQHTGTHRANDIIITPSKLSWASFGLSPVDLNIIASKREMTEELCNAYNYPSDLLGGDKKYNNFEQARRAVITDVIIPLCEARKEVENKIAKQFGDYVIEYDYTVFHELQDDLEKLARTMAIIDEITPNEKRTALGYDQLKDPNMDKIYFRSGKIPLDELNAMDEQVDEEQLEPNTPIE
jgi:HK97 family phage portal protein